MRGLKVLVLSGTLAASVMAPRVASAQWNAYDAMMSNNVYSRGWVNPYNNTLTNAYKWMTPTYSPTYTASYFSGSGSSRAARRRARLKSTPRREQTEAQRFAKYLGTMYKPGKADTPAQVAAIFAKGIGGKASDFTPVMRELWALYVKQAKSQGAPSTDVARTMAYCISANYYYFSGGTGVPETQVAKLRGKLREALSEDAKFRALSPVQKQQLNESMVILTHFSALGFEVIAKKAPQDKQALVREGFKKLAGVNLQGILGVAPERVAFAKDGLVIQPA